MNTIEAMKVAADALDTIIKLREFDFPNVNCLFAKDALSVLRTVIAAEEAKPTPSAERAALIDVLRRFGPSCNISRYVKQAADMLAADVKESS